MNPNEMQDPQAQFDVQRNPQDMQLMTDAMMYAPMLQKLDHEERKQAWPEIVSRLQKTSPKAATLDPSLPPSDEQLDELMSGYPEAKGAPAADTSRDAYLKAQVQRQIEGKPPISQADWEKEQSQKAAAPTEAPASPDAQGSAMEGMMPAQGGDDAMIDAARQQAQQGMGMKAGFGEEAKPPSGYKWLNDDPSTGKIVKIPEVDEQGNPIDENAKLTVKARGELQTNLIESEKNLHRVIDIHEKWVPEVYKYSGKLKYAALVAKGKLADLTPEETAYVTKFQNHKADVKEVFIRYRKLMSGVNFNPQETTDYKEVTISDDMSPQQAEAAKNRLIQNYMRDIYIYKNLLKKGIDLSNEDGGHQFHLMRQKMNKFYKAEMERLQRDNPNASPQQLQMYINKQLIDGDPAYNSAVEQ